MSERATWKSSAAYESEFYCFDSSDAPVTGLVNGDFTKQLTKDGSNSAVAVTVSEIDSSNEPGKYKAAYTPNATGYWSLRVANATYNARGWQDDIQVYADDIYAGTAQTGDSYARIGAAGAGLTALGDARIANLDATITSRTKPADTQAAVTLVTTTTNLTNAATSGDLTATMKASVTTAATAATPTAAAVTGAVGSVTAAVTVGTINTDVLSAAAVSAAAVTKIQAGLATPTNITAGTITTVTNLTNAPTVGDLTAAMKTSVTTAATAATPIAASVTGNVGGNVVGSVGSLTTNNDKTGYSLAADQAVNATKIGGTTQTGLDIAANYTAARAAKLDDLDATISSRLASVSYSAPPSAASIRSEIDANSTKLDVATSTRLASLSYTAPLDAPGTRSAVGLASANLDTQFAAIPANAQKIDLSTIEDTMPKQSPGAAALKLTSAFDSRTGETFKTNGTDVFMTQTPEKDANAQPVVKLGKPF